MITRRIFITGLLVVATAVSASAPKCTFTPEEVRQVARAAYVCGKIDGSLQAFAKAKEVSDFDTRAAVKAITELRKKASGEDVDGLVGDLRTKQP